MTTICWGVNRRYTVHVRARGCRKFHAVGKATRSKRVALRRLADEMARGGWQRGVVALHAEYYDPIAVYELEQR